MKKYSLGSLSEPESCQDTIDVSMVKKHILVHYLERMLLIRAVEQKLAIEKKNKIIGGPVHLSIGQEAVAVGLSSCLKSSDYVFSAHRSHSHLLALGSDIRKLFAEILGKATGHSKGMGGSMHLWDGANGFHGSVPIVAGTVPMAVGAAMAARLLNNGNVAVAYFGDGACEEGVVHESLNLASLNKEPIIFVVENNLFASHLHISERQPLNAMARYARANDIPYKIVDGNNVIEVAKVAKKFVNAARAMKGPRFIEAVTYRWLGHVDWREDVDVGISRSREDISSWRQKDPVSRLLNGMLQAQKWSSIEHNLLLEGIQTLVQDAWVEAVNDPYPEHEALLRYVY